VADQASGGSDTDDATANNGQVVVSASRHSALGGSARGG
jgi:hypothetical protein